MQCDWFIWIKPNGYTEIIQGAFAMVSQTLERMLHVLLFTLIQMIRRCY